MEQIYTIPINEAFEKAMQSDTVLCPLCLISEMLENNELEAALGAAMMEPDIRIRMNEKGFCREHLSKMFSAGKKLPFALILESHLESLGEKISPSGIEALICKIDRKKNSKTVSGAAESCYICERKKDYTDKIMLNLFYMWQKDAAFREKFKAQKGFCTEHYAMMLSKASGTMKGGDFSVFSKVCSDIESKYIAKVKDDISFFIKKFDYRYADEPWDGKKDAVEKALYALSGIKKDG